MKKHLLFILLLFFIIKIQAQTAEDWMAKGDKALSPLFKIECYTKAINLKPNLSNAYVKRGNALDSLKLYEEAIEEYTAAICLQFDHAEAYYCRGLTKKNPR
jgi:tetratricopeptide (TPR) repeat protein